MTPAPTIDLNADVGEGAGNDAELVPLVTSVNIACGAHAGDEATMREAVRLGMRHGCSIGAHPGFEDRAGFGRRERPVSPAEAADLVGGQWERLAAIASDEGAVLRHLKLHGALYNMVSRDTRLSVAVADVLVRGRTPPLLYALAGSVLASVGRDFGISVEEEGFADRAYRDDGTLLPRSEPGSVIGEADAAARQAVRIAVEHRVITPGGTPVAINASTLCLHGDLPHAVLFARAVRSALAAAGVSIKSPVPC